MGTQHPVMVTDDRPKPKPSSKVRSVDIRRVDNGYTMSVHHEQTRRMDSYVPPTEKVFTQKDELVAWLSKTL